MMSPKVLVNRLTHLSNKHLIALAYLVALGTMSGAHGDIEPQPNYDDSTNPTQSPNKHDTNTMTDAKTIFNTDLGFIHAFVASLSVIVVSELGDKTFFIAAIMAMRHPRLIVFTGAISALGLMTVLSAAFGMAATIIPRVYTYYISTALFAIFGLKMLKDGYYMSPTDAQEELEEVQSDLKKREDELLKSLSECSTNSPTVEALEQDDQELGTSSPMPSTGLLRMSASNPSNDTNVIELKQLNNKPSKRFEKETTTTTMIQDPESGILRKTKRSAGYITSRILMQAFTMTFLAEWGDRSQVTTIILSAREDVYGVIVGGVLGHSICTGLAVIGGRMIAQRISVRTVTLVGGVVFLLFAFSALFFSPEEEQPAVTP